MALSRLLLAGFGAFALLAGDPADAAARKPRTARLAEATFGLAAGEAWGTLSRGKACDRDPRPLTWDTATAGTAAGFPAIFGEVVADGAGSRTKPKLRVEAKVGELSARLCESARKHVTGTLAMTVTWRVVDPAQEKVLAVIETRASGDASEMVADAPGPLIEAAFRGNVQALAADAAFRKALKPPPRPRAKPATVAIEVPMAQMRLALATPAAPVSLDQAARAVVSILAGRNLGSGLLVTTDGYLLTNAHVVGAAKTVTVRWPDGEETQGAVVRSEPRRDVALIKTDPPKVLPLAIRRRPVTLAETVYAIGTPRETQFAGTLTRGVVSTAQRIMDGQAFIQSDVAITHGDSGGPLLDEKGWVVGITQSTYEPGGVSQNINFFIPIDEALKALALTPVG